MSLINENYTLELRAVKRIHNATDAHAFLASIEMADPESRKYVVLDCDAMTAKDIIVTHVRDIYMGRRNFHFLLTSLVSDNKKLARGWIFENFEIFFSLFLFLILTSLKVMDDFFNKHVLEFGAVNITGFRILQTYGDEYKRFFQSIKLLGLVNKSIDDEGSLSVGCVNLIFENCSSLVLD